ncbi:MAG: hypothetical protein Kilf2KO_16370 [Rhodospirillales bacterium]
MTFAPRALLFASVLLLGACASDPPPNVFTLVALPATQSLPAGGSVISVEPVDIPRYLDRPQIVRYGTTYQLEVSETARWGEPFGAMVTRVLIQDLSLRLPGAQIFTDGDAASVPAQRVLEVSFTGFEPDPTNTIVLSARWVVRQANDRTVLSSDAAEIRTTARDATMAGLASAMSDALAQLSQRIASSLTIGF